MHTKWTETDRENGKTVRAENLCCIIVSQADATGILKP